MVVYWHILNTVLTLVIFIKLLLSRRANVLIKMMFQSASSPRLEAVVRIRYCQRTQSYFPRYLFSLEHLLPLACLLRAGGCGRWSRCDAASPTTADAALGTHARHLLVSTEGSGPVHPRRSLYQGAPSSSCWQWHSAQLHLKWDADWRVSEDKRGSLSATYPGWQGWP